MRDSVKGQSFVSLGNPDPHIDGADVEIETGKKIFRQTSLNAHMGPEDSSNRKRYPSFFQAKFSEIAKRFQKCKS